jgi:hypothetical protein
MRISEIVNGVDDEFSGVSGEQLLEILFHLDEIRNFNSTLELLIFELNCETNYGQIAVKDCLMSDEQQNLKDMVIPYGDYLRTILPKDHLTIKRLNIFNKIMRN